MSVWSQQATAKCCGVLTVSMNEGRDRKIRFQVGKFTISGTRERVRVDIRGDHQIMQTDIQNFVGIDEAVLETIYRTGKWSMIEKGRSMF